MIEIIKNIVGIIGFVIIAMFFLGGILIFILIGLEFIKVTGNSLKVPWHHLNKENPSDEDLNA